ncbi:hypothetical protein COY23_02760 [bacterium (Candidatus Torokbacteria) CG_4_10_14_0_2_um_filter_35_8]|nr:MAG: hypothetical protein COY23_02760 [bacterium (Candidatus Torokbacteria) CG_4_10_14_0_2_um_filter_35_8]
MESLFRNTKHTKENKPLFKKGGKERRPFRLLFLVILFFAGLGLVLAISYSDWCSFYSRQDQNNSQLVVRPKKEKEESPNLKKQTILVKDKSITVEIADSEEERVKGLSNHESLDKNSGMLFIFDKEEIRSFTMKDTKILLSIAFISENGAILQIQDMQPFSNVSYLSEKPAMYALEMNQGWFEKNGVKENDKVSFEVKKEEKVIPMM